MNLILLLRNTFAVMVLIGEIRSETHMDIRILNGFGTYHNDGEFSAKSRIACVIKCLNIEECIATKYKSETMTCIIIHRQIVHLYEGFDDYTIIIVRDLPGLFVRKNSNSDYGYTYTEAANVCLSLGGRLMTLTELQKVFDEGFEICSCGWLDAGIRRYPMQQSISGCGNRIGIIDCDYATPYANAWCMP